jgi:hypothetical protein
MGLRKCKHCGKEISTAASRCPSCNGYVWTFFRKAVASVLLFFVIVGILKCTFGG